MKNKIKLFCFLAILFTSIPIFAQKKPDYNIYTSDIANFIRIYNSVDSINRIKVYQTQYLDQGTDGLRDYASNRFKVAKGLVERIYGIPDFYNKLIVTLTNTDFDALSKSCEVPINKFISLYDNPIVPEIYMLIGGVGNGSTIGKTGLLMGLDSYLLCFEDRSKFIYFEIGVAHELIHFNQTYIANDSVTALIEDNLLAQVIKEGSADFLGELISGKVQYCNLEMYKWGEAHIKQLWSEFKEDIHDSTKMEKWLYNDQPDRPGSLGYFMGYKITKAYYDKASDKKQAIKEILTIPSDGFYEFLVKSGYDGE